MEETYYSAGELAHLLGISKQTMMYYEKMNILQPEKIAENGYRCYSMDQYLTLEIIVFLRRLNIPVPKIREYLSNRSSEAFLSLLEERRKQCEEVIREHTTVRDAIAAQKTRIKRQIPFIPDQVLLESTPPREVFITLVSNTSKGGTAAITARAAHILAAFSDTVLKESPTGWGFDRRRYFSKDYCHAASIITEVPTGSHVKGNAMLPDGLYASLMIKGTYFRQAQAVYERLTSFLSLNHLAPIGDVYIFPIIDYWLTDDPTQYISRVTVLVERKADET